MEVGRTISTGLRIGLSLLWGFAAPPIAPTTAQDVPRVSAAAPSDDREEIGAPATMGQVEWTFPFSPTGPPASDSPYSPQVGSHRPEDAAQLYERVLDLEPERQNRQLIERVRAAVQDTEVGIDTTDEEWVTVKGSSITWGGRIHADWINWANDTQFGGQSNYVEFRRLRLFAAGEGYGVYDYQLDLAFTPELDADSDDDDEGTSFELKDAFVGIRDVPYVGYVRFGHFRTPFNLSSLTSSNDITFLERSLPFRLAPGRALGLAAYNLTPAEDFTWACGAFFDDLPQDSPGIENDNQGTQLIGRVTWLPYYDVASQGRYLLHTGLSYAYTRPRLQDDSNNPATSQRSVRYEARPEIHLGDPLVDTGTIDAQQVQALDAELAVVRGPLSLQSEFVWTGIDEAAGGRTTLYGAYAYASMFLTGEHRQYNRRWAAFDQVTPLENFWMVRTPRGTRRGWGAWEVAARWSYLDFSDVGGQQLHDLTVGMNWYWNPYTRVMLNWIHPWAKNSPQSSLRQAEGDVLSMRMQVAF